MNESIIKYSLFLYTVKMSKQFSFNFRKIENIDVSFEKISNFYVVFENTGFLRYMR